MRRASVVSTSRSAAAASEVTTPTQRGKAGSSRFEPASKTPSRSSFSLSAQEALVERPYAGLAHRLDAQLEASARLVEGDAAPALRSARRSPARSCEQRGAAAEHHAFHLRLAVLQREVAVPGGARDRFEISPLTQSSGKRRSRLSRTLRSNSETVTTPADGGGSGVGNRSASLSRASGEPHTNPHRRPIDAGSPTD